MESPHVVRVKHLLKIMEEMAEHSKSMSLGAKSIIKNNCSSIRKELEYLELELMARK